MWLIIRRAGSGGKLHSRIFFWTNTIHRDFDRWLIVWTLPRNQYSFQLNIVTFDANIFNFVMAFCLFHDICISLSNVLNFQIPESQFPGSGRYGRFRSGWKVQSPALFLRPQAKHRRRKRVFFLQRGRILFWWLALTQLVSWLVLCHLLISQISLSVFNSCVLRILPIAANWEVEIRTLKNTEFSIFFRRALILAKALFIVLKTFGSSDHYSKRRRVSGLCTGVPNKIFSLFGSNESFQSVPSLYNRLSQQ